MIKILVIDNYLPRHEQIISDIDSVFEVNQKRVEISITVSSIKPTDFDLILIHKNNSEYFKISNTAGVLSKYLIIYSGGASGFKDHTDYLYLAAPDKVKRALIKIKGHMKL